MKSILTLGTRPRSSSARIGGAAAQGTMSKGGAMMNHAMVARHMVVKLNAMGGSGESGTATLTRTPAAPARRSS